jgi:hypothetical protein
MARRQAAKRQTNVEFVADIMEHSAYGPLAQLFVLDALDQWSRRVAAADPAKVDTALISGAAWVGVAQEIQAKIGGR